MSRHHNAGCHPRGKRHPHHHHHHHYHDNEVIVMIIRKAYMIALHLGHSYTEEGGASPVPGGSWLAQVNYCHYHCHCHHCHYWPRWFINDKSSLLHHHCHHSCHFQSHCHHCYWQYGCHWNHCFFSGALPQCTFTNKNPTAAGALADYCQFLRQNPFMVIIATHSWFLPLLLLLSVPQVGGGLIWSC